MTTECQSTDDDCSGLRAPTFRLRHSEFLRHWFRLRRIEIRHFAHTASLKYLFGFSRSASAGAVRRRIAADYRSPRSRDTSKRPARAKPVRAVAGSVLRKSSIEWRNIESFQNRCSLPSLASNVAHTGKRSQPAYPYLASTASLFGDLTQRKPTWLLPVSMSPFPRVPIM